MTYCDTHPWLTFDFDVEKIPPLLWMKLGKVQANCIRLSEVPLQPEVAKRLLSLSLSKGAHATAAIEGNTLSEDDVLKKVEGEELSLPPSREELGLEIDNVLNAYNKVLNELREGGDQRLTINDVKAYNKLLLQGLDNEEWVEPGEFRTVPVSVHTYTAVPQDECEPLMQKALDWINQETWVSDLDRISNAIIRALVAHLYIAWIHPFGDGNGRVARLVELKILLSSGVPNVGAHLLTNHYNKTRVHYYRQLDQASRSGGNVFPFLQYALDGFQDSLTEEFSVIRKQHLTIAWRNYIYDFFKTMAGQINERRRKLVLDLSDYEKPVKLNEIRNVSPRVARLYADRTVMTIRRDLSTLLKQKLIRYDNGGYVANRELMESFLPERIEISDGQPSNDETEETG